ncbi:hypothetical protein TNCV_5069301 [Trichonephila clavipes]|nr:hypothetical protein TNCV_5069301 [Trichonephila clavipes]
MFSAMHNLSLSWHTSISAFDEAAFCLAINHHDVAKWARHCLACQKSKIHRHTRSPLSSFQNLPNVLIMFIWISLDLYLHQMATPIA